MTWALLGLAASYLAILCIGFLAGLYVNRGYRRIPEHPTLRHFRIEGTARVNAIHAARLRLVEPPPYDQDRETRLGG